MKPSDEAALLVMAADHAKVDKALFVRWADQQIADYDLPDNWMIELSTLQSECIEDYISLLRHACNQDLCDTEHRIMTVIDAHRSGVVSLDEALSSLWKIWSGPDNRYNTIGFPEDLSDALVRWDCLDDLVHIPADLSQRFEILFDQFRLAHPDMITHYRDSNNKANKPRHDNPS